MLQINTFSAVIDSKEFVWCTEGAGWLPEEGGGLLVPGVELLPAPAPTQHAHRLQVAAVQHQHPAKPNHKKIS
jgi:hypothetical protein